MTGQETERSRIIANERIHVERVIGKMKKKIMVLRGLVKIKDFCSDSESNAFISKKFSVCCCLMNAMSAIITQY